MSMHLDFQTVYTVAALSLLATGAVVALAASSYTGDLSRIGYLWATAVGFAVVSYALVGMKGVVPEAVRILGAHASGLAATCGFYHACLRLTKRRTHLLLIYSPVAVEIASTTYFSFVAPNLSARIAVFSALGALSMGLCAVTLAPRGKPAPLTSRIGSLGFALGCAVLVLRGVVRMTKDPAVSIQANFAASTSEQISILLTFIVSSALSMLFLVICNERLNRELERLATLDPLTGRFNRRTIEDCGRRETANARRRSSPLAIALIDLDEFKEINDRHGHAVGDAAIRFFVAILEQNLRARDVLGRYGGDEFIVVMPETDAAGAGTVCERLRELLASSPFDSGSFRISLTASTGVASLSGEAAEFEELVHLADAALYEAKRNGRNRVCAAASAPRPAEWPSRVNAS